MAHPTQMTNQLFIKIATALEDDLKQDRYQILIPTLTHGKSPVYQTPLAEFSLSDCILVDNYQHLIPISEIFSGYEITYTFRNPFTGQAFTPDEVNQIKNHPEYKEQFSTYEQRDKSLKNGIAPENFDQIQFLIDEILCDHPNRAECAIVTLTEYIDALSPYERRQLNEANVRENLTFEDLLTTLRTENVCSHAYATFLRNFIERVNSAHDHSDDDPRINT